MNRDDLQLFMTILEENNLIKAAEQLYLSPSTAGSRLRAMEEELGYPCRVVATGGLAGMVVPHCRRKVECSDTLLLDGLKVIYQWAGRESQS